MGRVGPVNDSETEKKQQTNKPVQNMTSLAEGNIAGIF